VEANRIQKAMPTSSSNPVYNQAWVSRFLDRHDIVIRKRTTACQKDPTELVPKLVQFIQFVRKLRVENDYKLADNCMR
jgi:hypothetical protein